MILPIRTGLLILSMKIEFLILPVGTGFFILPMKIGLLILPVETRPFDEYFATGLNHGVESHWKNSIAKNLNHGFFRIFAKYKILGI